MKIGLLFSGQGAQTPGMCKSFADNFQECRDLINHIDITAGRKLSELCFDGSQELLNETHNTQPCLLLADLCAYVAFQKLEIAPSYVAGFSLGEYAALVASGSLKIEDAFRIIQIRADLMQEAVPSGEGGMLALMTGDAHAVENMCSMVDGFAEPANYNCRSQIVVSGEIAAIKQVAALAKERKIRAVQLPVSAPFHCKMMEPASSKFAPILESLEYYAPSIPIIMNVDAIEVTDPSEIRYKLGRQMTSPVLWEQTLIRMNQLGVDCFVELGIGNTLTKFVEKTFPDNSDIGCYTISDVDSLEIFSKFFKGHTCDGV